MKFLAIVLMFGLAGSMAPARALEPKTLETDWDQGTYFSSFTSVTSKNVDLAGFGSWGVDTRKADPSANVIGFSFSLYPVGAGADFYISHTTKTLSALAWSTTGYNVPAPTRWAGSSGYRAVLSTTSTMSIPQSLIYNQRFETVVMNPRFFFENLSASATYYFWLTYGRPKGR